MTQAQRIAALEAVTQRRRERPSVKAVIVQLSKAEPDAATLAQAEAWSRLPACERREVAPWGIAIFET